jgi:hypothetical protein
MFLIKSFNSIAQTNTVSVKFERNSDNSISFEYEKSAPGSYMLTVTLSNLTNSHNNEFNGIVNSSSGRLFKLMPIDKGKSIGFSYKYTYNPGITNPTIDSLFVYALPFKKGTVIKVSESSNVNHSYLGQDLPKNWKAYHFQALAADTVYAARKGEIIAISDQFETDTISYYTSKKNTITVEHADGTWATYTGFAKNRSFVKLGQTVYPQMPLGLIKEPYLRQSNDFSFMLFYFSDGGKKSKSEPSNGPRKSVFITPYFNTETGIVQLKSQFRYQVVVDEEIIIKEMTKRELKNRLKQTE